MVASEKLQEKSRHCFETLIDERTCGSLIQHLTKNLETLMRTCGSLNCSIETNRKFASIEVLTRSSGSLKKILATLRFL